jgi:thioesterase domain-containing protein
LSEPDRPLFVAPALGATGAETAAFAAALRAQGVAVHALAPPAPGDAAPRTVEGAAARCVRMIRAVQPAGPYRLAGWSAGGVVAYEIATQLVGQDEPVEFLALLDTAYPDGAAPTAYALPPAPVMVHLFTAGERSDDDARGWGASAGDGVRAERVPGTPESMVRADAASTAAAVAKALRAAEAASGGGRARAAAFEPLVTIQSAKARAGAHAPVFCVPGAGDHVVQFVDFVSALGDGWPVHGLQYRGVDDARVPHTSVEAAAAAYLKSIDAVAPDGGVHLIGHSFGGWIAFELALRMAARGRPPRSLTVIDSDAPDGTGIGGEFSAAGVYAEFVRALELAAQRPLGISGAALEQRDEAARLRLVHERMVAVGLMPRRSQPDMLTGSVRAFGVALRTGYAPRAPYGGPVALAFASDPSLGADDDARRQDDTFAAWRRWAPAATRWQAPGNHLTVLQPPHVRSLAEWWKRSSIDSAGVACGA